MRPFIQPAIVARGKSTIRASSEIEIARRFAAARITESSPRSVDYRHRGGDLRQLVDLREVRRNRRWGLALLHQLQPVCLAVGFELFAKLGTHAVVMARPKTRMIARIRLSRPCTSFPRLRTSSSSCVHVGLRKVGPVAPDAGLSAARPAANRSAFTSARAGSNAFSLSGLPRDEREFRRFFSAAISEIWKGVASLDPFWEQRFGLRLKTRLLNVITQSYRDENQHEVLLSDGMLNTLPAAPTNSGPTEENRQRAMDALRRGIARLGFPSRRYTRSTTSAASSPCVMPQKG